MSFEIKSISIIDWGILTQHKIEPEDLYHPNHPYHHLVLDEIEEYTEAYEEYEHEEWRCVNGHDRCYGGVSAGPECPYCEPVLPEEI
jgi:hypothetical protein